MYKLFYKNGLPFITFKTVINNNMETRTITRRLYPCKASPLHSAQYMIFNGRKFWINDNAIIKQD